MLTTAPYLRVRRPSPTTAEFIVSTLPPLTLPLRLALYTVNFLRLVFGFGLLLLLYSAWTQSPYAATPPSLQPPHSHPQPSILELASPASASLSPTDLDLSVAAAAVAAPSSPFPPSLLSTAFLHHLARALLTSTAAGRLCARASQSAPSWLLIPGALAALYTLTLRIHTEERLLVLRGLGIQTSSSKGSVLGGRAVTRFIPTEKIQDVLINEAFRGFEVRHCLVVVVDDEEDVVVVFPRLLPRPRIVEKVWRGIRECAREQGEVCKGYDGRT
ncbi:hypothetical protein F5B20DRAFT_347209 [Whalleya microplaca]|nr:hypothetical protein F5B20DRAFT_347209 [Whalleya microplaca]